MLQILILLVILLIIAGVILVLVFSPSKDREKRKTHLFVKPSDQEAHIFRHGIEELRIYRDEIKDLKAEIHTRIVGMHHFVNSFLITLLSGGHLLIEGVPGLAKTKTVSLVASLLDLDFSRIQFTPDMLPADIVGSQLYNQQQKSFETIVGPVFANVILADEINRTTPKVQSELLEAMQEQQVTISGDTKALPSPFFVLATQNPLDQDGTFSLPRAQLDRFFMKVIVTYPSQKEEVEILNVREQEEQQRGKASKKKNHILTKTQLVQMMNEIKEINVSEKVKEYIAKLAVATRNASDYLEVGLSPRGSIALFDAAKTCAYLEGKQSVELSDVQKVFLDVARHRVIPNQETIRAGNSVDDILVMIARGVK